MDASACCIGAWRWPLCQGQETSGVGWCGAAGDSSLLAAAGPSLMAAAPTRYARATSRRPQTA